MSDRTPSGGSIAFSFHWAHRPLLVNEPSRSIQCVVGKYSTSVSISAGFIPGAFQNSALSSMNGSMTVIHFRRDIDCNNLGMSGPASSGLNPSVMNPSSRPWNALSQIDSQVASPSCFPR